MLPDASLYHSVTPAYIADLIDTLGWTKAKVARRLGCTERMLYYYLNGTCESIPYAVQYTLEQLVEGKREQ